MGVGQGPSLSSSEPEKLRPLVLYLLNTQAHATKNSHVDWRQAPWNCLTSPRADLSTSPSAQSHCWPLCSHIRAYRLSRGHPHAPIDAPSHKSRPNLHADIASYK